MFYLQKDADAIKMFFLLFKISIFIYKFCWRSEKKANTMTFRTPRTNMISSRVDPLISILAVLARSCQILSTSWQPWISWQDSY